MRPPSTIITVSELTHAIKNQLESRFVGIAVQGEISNAKLHSSGHFYFDLKDTGAKISAVMFRGQAQKLERLPKEGDQVIIKGGISVYPPHGKYQMIVQNLEYMGIGELLLKLEALKKKLLEKGWFDPEKKKQLPKYPKTIGVVTSPTGAVIKDIIHVLKRRFPGFHLLLCPVRVQGAEAPLEIVEAIEHFNHHQRADVLIVGRGGGSLEDLWAFNDERVAKAIFESSIPIISAVGHETDVTIADFVADIRAATPSAAAEIVSNEVNRYRTQLMSYMRHPFIASAYALLAEPMQKLDDIKTRLDERMRNEILKRRYLLTGREQQAGALKPTAQIALFRQKMIQLEKRVTYSYRNLLNMKEQKLKEVVKHLKALDPKNVLKRGYSILFAEKGGSVIVSAQQLSAGEQIHALLSDGEVTLKVDHARE